MNLAPPSTIIEQQMKTRIVGITLLLFVPLAASAQTAEEVVKKALDARGGAGKIKHLLPRSNRQERKRKHQSSGNPLPTQ